MSCAPVGAAALSSRSPVMSTRQKFTRQESPGAGGIWGTPTICENGTAISTVQNRSSVPGFAPPPYTATEVSSFSQFQDEEHDTVLVFNWAVELRYIARRV